MHKYLLFSIILTGCTHVPQPEITWHNVVDLKVCEDGLTEHHRNVVRDQYMNYGVNAIWTDSVDCQTVFLKTPSPIHVALGELAHTEYWPDTSRSVVRFFNGISDWMLRHEIMHTLGCSDFESSVKCAGHIRGFRDD